jgi:hypothetical protein
MMIKDPQPGQARQELEEEASAPPANWLKHIAAPGMKMYYRGLEAPPVSRPTLRYDQAE